MSVGRSGLRNGIPFPGAVPGSAQPDAQNRAGRYPATVAISSYADADSPARGLTFSAMTPNAVKRRRFRTKRDEVENFLLSAPALGPLRRTLLSPGNRKGGKPEVRPAVGADIHRAAGRRSCRRHRSMRPEECAFHPAGEFDAFEGRIALMGFGFRGANHKFGMRIDENDVGVVAGRDVAFAEQAEPLRRVPAQKLGHVVVRHAAPAALAQHAGEQILGAAEARFRQPDIVRIVLGPFLLGRTAGVIADDPVDLAVEHGLP